MSSMLKLSAIALLLSSLLHASSEDKKVVDFLKKSFSNNPSVVIKEITVSDKSKVDSMSGWSAYIIKVDAKIKAQEGERDVVQKMIYFSNGKLITQDLVDLNTNESLKENITPTFKDSFYSKANLVYGNANAKHKVAIFSDPLCPYCRTYVPEAIEFMKKDPKKFAIYYYHFPLVSMHPASVVLTKAAIAAELKGHKNAVLDLYKVEVNPRETNAEVILKAFNQVLKTNIKVADIASAEVTKHFDFGMHVADELMVQGTPSVYFNSKVDKTKKMYEKAK